MGVEPASEISVTSVNAAPSGFYTRAQVIAKIKALDLEISGMSIRRHVIDAGRLPGIKIGKQLWLRRGPVDEFLDAAQQSDGLIDIETWEPSTPDVQDSPADEPADEAVA